MGRLLQPLLSDRNRREEILRMLVLSIILTVTVSAQGAPGGRHFAYGHHQDHCHTEYSVRIEESCHDEYDEECHEEYDTVVDTTYVEECQDIVTQHCHETTQQVHHSAAVVGQDSHVVPQGHAGYSKRAADPLHRHNHHNNLQCFSKPHKQCHQKPVQNQRQECHEEYDVIVDTTYIEECQDIITTHCQETSQQVHHSSAVVGHDSQVVAHGHTGYGYGKREAEPGYSTGPQCHDKKDRQCAKRPVQNERKIPRTVCVPYEVKVPYEVCGHSHVHVEQYANGYARGYGHY